MAAEAIIGQIPRLLEPVNPSREERADASHVNGRIFFSAHHLIDGADIQAGRALDAAQNLLEGGISQDFRAVVVEQDNMEVFVR